VAGGNLTRPETPGHPEGPGALLHALRTDRGLSLRDLEKLVPASAATLSRMERALVPMDPAVARCCDDVLKGGGALARLAAATYARAHALAAPEGPAQVLLVHLSAPEKVIIVPVSRRDLLGALALGAAATPILTIDRALADAGVHPDEPALARYSQALASYAAAGRVGAPAPVLHAVTGDIAALEALHRRATNTPLSGQLRSLQARYAEFAGWMAEESDDLFEATYWTDRAGDWATQAGDQNIAPYLLARRAVLATHAGDAHRTVQLTTAAQHTPGITPDVLRITLYEQAKGYALLGERTASQIALNTAMNIDGCTSNGPRLGPTLTPEQLQTSYQVQRDIYLGHGSQTVEILEADLPNLAASSLRGHIIHSARLAAAYAQAGDPHRACLNAGTVLETTPRIGSATAVIELRRAIPFLRRWSNDSAVADVIHHITTLA
jgi:hypothetical protein